MKKLMSILTACLFVFTLASCGGDKSSNSGSGSEASGSDEDNGAWSEEFKKECIDSSMKEMKIDEDGLLEALLSVNPNIDLNQLANCECEIAEKTLPNIQSYSEIEIAVEKDSTLGIQMMKSLMECSEDFGEAFENLMWEQIYQGLSYNAGESFAECIVSQAKEKYDIFGLMENGGEKIVDEFMYDCEGLLPEM